MCAWQHHAVTCCLARMAAADQWMIEGVTSCMLLMQVKNNYIASYGPAFMLGSDVFAPTPFNYVDMNNILFMGNTIINSQFGTVTLESAGTVTLSNTAFINLMCE